MIKTLWILLIAIVLLIPATMALPISKGEYCNNLCNNLNKLNVVKCYQYYVDADKLRGCLDIAKEVDKYCVERCNGSRADARDIVWMEKDNV